MDSPTLKQYRELLGVNEHANKDDLKKAYHKLALLYHPDRNSDPLAVEQFQKLRKAFEFLNDPLLVADLKRNHLKERLFNSCIEGLEISFGSFFGYRVYVSSQSVIPKEKRIGKDPGADTPVNADSTVYV